MNEICKGKGGLWPEGKIRYRIDESVEDDCEL